MPRARKPAKAAEAAREPERIVLPAALDARTVGPLAERLRAARGAPLALDAGEVRKLGGQGAQLLLAAARAWRDDAAAFHVVAASPDFEEALRLLGLAPDALTSGDAR